MSKHKTPPEWYGQGYAGLAGWGKAIEQVREFLQARARGRERKDATYTQVSRVATAIDWPDGPHTHEGQQMGLLLGNLSIGEWLEDRPLLSAIVVYADDPPRPGPGFHALAEELGFLPVRNEDTELIFWGEERDRCFDYWRTAH